MHNYDKTVIYSFIKTVTYASSDLVFFHENRDSAIQVLDNKIVNH